MRWSPHRVLTLAWIALLPWAAGAQDSASTPLSPPEMQAVRQEIDTVVKLNENVASTFKPTAATPARIDRLYRMPEVTRLPRVVRENGLILAGHGSLLSFDKPSDILSKVSAWFPEEVAASRQAKDPGFFGHLHLYGPYADWAPEPRAFLALWKCMPHIAWLKPKANPFQRRFNDGLPFWQNGARDSGHLDFGECVRERIGYQPAWTQAEFERYTAQARDIGQRTAPVVADKFDRFLSANGCAGTGPDDCVLVLWMWSSLSPQDARLAQALRTLEAAVRPTDDFPPLARPPAEYAGHRHNGEARFDAALRKAAFLRAKLISVSAAPQAWPATALADTLKQMAALRAWYVANVDWRGSELYALEYYNEQLNPWAVAVPESALLSTLEGLADDADCALYEPWFAHGGKTLAIDYVLHMLEHGRRPRCAGIDWDWLSGADAQASAARQQLIARLGRIDSGTLQDSVLEGLSANGERCADKQRPPWRAALCQTWIGAPQVIGKRSAWWRLGGTRAARYTLSPLPPLPKMDDARPDAILGAQAQWLTKQVLPSSDDATGPLAALAADLTRQRMAIASAKRWRHPQGRQSVIELQLFTLNPLAASDGAETQEGRILLVIDAGGVQRVRVPTRFNYQYDDGEIVRVSDLDGDGHPEVWFTGTFGECDDEGLKPGIDCAIETIHMGEVYHDALSYFIDNRPTR